MKKPYFNEIEREIIKEDNSLFASRANLLIANHLFFKTVIKGNMIKAMERFQDLIVISQPKPKK